MKINTQKMLKISVIVFLLFWASCFFSKHKPSYSLEIKHNWLNNGFISEDNYRLLITNHAGRLKLYDLINNSLITSIEKKHATKWGIAKIKPIQAGFIDDNNIILHHFHAGIISYDISAKKVSWKIPGDRGDRIIKVPKKHLFVLLPNIKNYIEIRSTVDGQLLKTINIELNFIKIECVTENLIIISNPSGDPTDHTAGQILIIDINKKEIVEKIKLDRRLFFRSRCFGAEKFCAPAEGGINFYDLHTGNILKKIKYDINTESFWFIKFLTPNKFLVADKNKHVFFDYETEEAITEYVPPESESIGKCVNSTDCRVVFNHTGTAYYLINDKMEYKKISFPPINDLP
jgi:hypothetical protein